MMRNIHNKLSGRYGWYSNWHNHPKHEQTHFGVLFLSIVLATSVILTSFVANKSIASVNQLYISQNGGGTQDGSSCTNAKPVTFFNTASNWGTASTQIGPGTVVRLCGTISTNLTVQASGASGSPITVLFETGAKISVPACGDAGCINVQGVSHIIIDGSPTSLACGVVNGIDVACNGIIEATNSGTGKGNAPSKGINARSSSNIEVRNLIIRNMYVHIGTGDDVQAPSYYGIHFDGAGHKFHNNIIHDAEGGIVGEAPNSGNLINNNQIYNSNWGVFLSGPGYTWPDAVTNNKIYNNNVHDFANWDTTSNTYHHDGIFVAGNDVAKTGVSNIDIYNNYVHGSVSNCPNNCMTAYIYVPWAKNVRIFNNLLVAPPGEYFYNGLLFLWDVSDPLIANNTIIGGDANFSDACVRALGLTNASIVNNVVSSCDVLLWLDGTTPATLDNNTYQRSSLTDAWRINSIYYSTLAAWRSATGKEANGQATTASLSLDSGYVPQAGSVLIGKGGNFTSLGIATLNSDKAGTPRPSTGAWDIGAYQSGGSVSISSATSPTPPPVPTPTPTPTPITSPVVPPGCSVSSAVWQNSSLTTQTSTFTVNYDVTPNINNMDGVIGLSSGPASRYTNLSAIVRFNDMGVIDAMNTSAYSSLIVMPYTAGTKYHIRIVINPQSQTYSVYVTAPGSAEVQLANNYNFRATALTTNLNNWAMLSEIGNFTVCNFTLSYTPTINPTPTPPPSTSTSTVSSPVPVATSTPPSTNKFLLNDRVKANSRVRVRQTPSTTGKAICTQNRGVLGTVIGGPQVAKGYTWWKINYDSSCDGWSAQDYLDLYSRPTAVKVEAPTVAVLPPQNSRTGFLAAIIFVLDSIYNFLERILR